MATKVGIVKVGKNKGLELDFDPGATSFELDRYESKWEALASLFVKNSTDRELFKVLIKWTFINFENGTLGTQKAAYDIAALMRFDLSNEEPFEEIIDLAGELELPRRLVDDYDAKWQQMTALIAQLELKETDRIKISPPPKTPRVFY